MLAYVVAHTHTHRELQDLSWILLYNSSFCWLLCPFSSYISSEPDQGLPMEMHFQPFTFSPSGYPGAVLATSWVLCDRCSGRLPVSLPCNILVPPLYHKEGSGYTAVLYLELSSESPSSLEQSQGSRVKINWNHKDKTQQDQHTVSTGRYTRSPPRALLLLYRSFDGACYCLFSR